MGETYSENNNILELKSISNIHNEKFIIPSFQRGYRWEPVQVITLLEDIKEYIEKKLDTFMCLQPVVFYKKNNNDNKLEELVVVDGQQRLTTIAVISRCLELDNINIEYNKNNKALQDILNNVESYLNTNKMDINNLFNDNNKLLFEKTSEIYEKIFLSAKNNSDKVNLLDEYYIILSYLTMKCWLENEKNIEESIKSIKNLFKSDEDNFSIKFIWYDVTGEINGDETKAINIFTRLNIGKIELTDAELIKALFLKKDNFKDSELDKKLHIAYKWDEIEKTLNNDTFWYFISNRNDDEIEKRNRIELILELAAGKNNGKNHELFKEYENKLKEKNKLDELWQQIEECFMTLKEWYNDNEMYHYIGYYLYFKNNIHDLYQNIKSKSIYEQKKDIIKRVKDILFNNKYKFKVVKNCYTNEYIQKYYNENNNDNDFLNLNYYDDNAKQIFHNILLFIDIYNYINLNKSNNIYNTSQCFFINRFPFDIFKYEKNKQWSLEHIASQKDPEIKDDKRLSFIQDILKELNLINIEIYDSFKSKIEDIIGNEYLNTNISINDEQWQQIIEIINNLNSGDTNIDTEKYKNSLCNLALLQKDINSEIGNKPFIIKRNILLNKKHIENTVKIDINKRYIPNNTINAFSKIFNKNAITLIYWTENDMLSYGCYILNILQDFSIKGE